MTASGLPMARISLKWGMIEGDLSIAEKFRLVADLGYDGIELDAPCDLSLDEVRAARDATGLALPGVVNSVHWATPLTDPDAAVRRAGFEGTVRAIETAGALGAETVLLVPGMVTRETGYRAAFERAEAQIAALLPVAEAAGVTIALENVWNDFLLSPLEAAQFVDHFESGSLGWYLDIGNILKYGNPEDWIEELNERIVRIDIKEFSLEKMNSTGPWSGFDVALGEGDCDWPRINAALREVGYSGWASLEVPGGDGARLRALREDVERLRAL